MNHLKSDYSPKIFLNFPLAATTLSPPLQGTGSPVIGADGTIYFSTLDRVYAINPDGLQQWSTVFTTDAVNRRKPGSPALGTDGTIYVGSSDKHLYAIDSNGQVKWKFKTDSYVDTPAIGSDGTIYAGDGTIDGGTGTTLYAITPDGTKKWSFDKAGNRPAGSRPIVAADGTIYVSKGSIIYGLSPDGSKKIELNISTDKSFEDAQSSLLVVVDGKTIDSDGKLYFTARPRYIGRHNMLYALSTPSSGLADSSWPQYRGFQNNGRIGVSVPNSSLTNSLQASDFSPRQMPEKWRVKLEGNPTGQALGADGIIYVSRSKHLDAIDSNGQVKWKFKTDGAVGTPAISSDGTIYVGSYDNGDKFYAVNPDGSQKWVVDMDWGTHPSTPAIGFDGTIYIGGHETFVAFNPDGSQKWATEHRYIKQPPAIGIDGTIYVSGRSYIKDNVGLDGKDLVDGLYALNPDGSQKWAFVIEESSSGQESTSPILGVDGTIYIGRNSGHLYAVNPDGTLAWNFEIEEKIIASPSIGTDGTLYLPAVGTGRFSDRKPNKFYAINSDGTQKWAIEVGQRFIGASPLITFDGIIYISDDRTIYGFNSEGKQIYVYPHGSGYNLTLTQDGVMYLLNSDFDIVFAVQTPSKGLANSPWPKAGQNNQNSGRKL